MIAYPDTSFLCAIYRLQESSPMAAAYFAQMGEPLHVSTPLLFEFRQSVRWQAYLNSKDKTKGFNKVTAEACLGMLASHISAEHVKVVPIEWTAVIGKAEELSAQHTMKEGFRAFDLLHLATALHLKATEFLTFDLKQRKLAEKLGFIVPL